MNERDAFGVQVEPVGRGPVEPIADDRGADAVDEDVAAVGQVARQAVVPLQDAALVRSE